MNREDQGAGFISSLNYPLLFGEMGIMAMHVLIYVAVGILGLILSVISHVGSHVNVIQLRLTVCLKGAKSSFGWPANVKTLNLTLPEDL